MTFRPLTHTLLTFQKYLSSSDKVLRTMRTANPLPKSQRPVYQRA